MAETLDVLVIGAGIAGLSCAKSLQAAGMSVRVVDKGRGVGGRCATRRVEGQPVDHGVSFFHGTDPIFLDELSKVEATPVAGWPSRIRGVGPPCQPEAFRSGTRCMSFEEGVSVFPKHLARGLDITLQTRVEKVERGDTFRVQCEQGEEIRCRRLVMALPVPQVAALLKDWSGVHSLQALLSMVVPHPSLTVMAGYPLGLPEPEFDIYFPEESRILQAVIHDSSKRKAPRQRVLVLQARPSWSSRHLMEPSEVYAAEILEECANLLGEPWGAPEWVQSHRWRYATLPRGTGLPRPFRQQLEGGLVLGITGEAFHPASGVEGAYLAGLTLGRLLLQEIP